MRPREESSCLGLVPGGCRVVSLCLRYARGSSGDCRDGFTDENLETWFILWRRRRKKGEGRKETEGTTLEECGGKAMEKAEGRPPPFSPSPPLVPLSHLSSPFLSLPFFFF